MAKIHKFVDGCGYYDIIEHKDGKCSVYHYTCGRSFKVGSYSSLKGARIGLARYCGGMPYYANLYCKKGGV